MRGLNLFRRAATINSSKRQLLRAVCVIWSALVVQTSRADLYSCQETGAVSIDPHTSSVIDEYSADITQRRWVVDTDQGWHRAEFPGYRGSCKIENGYVVCRTKNIAYGEATCRSTPIALASLSSIQIMDWVLSHSLASATSKMRRKVAVI